MKKLIQDMKDVMAAIAADIDKNTKAAEARVRKNTLRFAELGKQYRKDSIAARR